ncbi:hypothetical protein CEUSTIGMA_g11058.t1 [Chlamydomonas eustigma]|uniref:Guanylyl cyclase n=1 Tax=Chlamydomonas eustigma TaxID=1157962 RepID=A0A250XKN1_9CHLO|nr:hypothetical protein CEUSTIGMA_g11058.t1 [Chlamydomonas eustigma]|eukprot:GAX83634.1 hypothetical protein CEUSTIGMA_g11058.t1 [Chlamydomonas eustigma]
MPDMTQLSCSQQSQIRPLHDADMIELKGSETSTSYGHEVRDTGRCASVVPRTVPHCKQHFSWDCGLACVFMVVKAFNAAALQSTPQVSDPHESDYDKLRELCPTTSIWTVDLAHLLRRLGLEVCFLTKTLGPNPAYANEGFYMEHLQEDELRVSQLFSEANTAGIALHQRSLSSQELQEVAVTGACLVIALVDKRKLDPWLLTADLLCPTLLGGSEKGSSCEGDGGYTGHYVLIVGFDISRQEFIVHDPAAPVSELRVSASALDLARRSFGTDEDLLIVPCDRSVISRLLASGSAGGESVEQALHEQTMIQPEVDQDKSVMLQGACSVTTLASSLVSSS